MCDSLVSAGYLHTCALVGGGLKCWGEDLYGQLGDGAGIESHVPLAVSGLSSGVVAVSAGTYHTCAVTAAGGVKCWGDNLYGELGNATTTENDVPVDVVGLSTGIVSIAAGRYETCAVTSAGGVKCWGKNLYGQLGNNSNTESHVPVAVMGLSTGGFAVDAGEDHTCAITAAGAIKCWGSNVDGRLGNNSTSESHVPVDVTGLASGGALVSAGSYHTCAVTTAGTVKCWGDNLYGQLGINSTTDSHVPVDVMGP